MTYIFFPIICAVSTTERPNEFLITQLEQLRVSKMRSLDCPSLFNDTNLDAVLGILDPTNQGHITFVQYKEGESEMVHLIICEAMAEKQFGGDRTVSDKCIKNKWGAYQGNTEDSAYISLSL